MGYNKIKYEGKVAGYSFGTLIGTFNLITYAESEAAARRNFEFQLKQKCRLSPSARIKVDILELAVGA